MWLKFLEGDMIFSPSKYSIPFENVWPVLSHLLQRLNTFIGDRSDILFLSCKMFKKITMSEKVKENFDFMTHCKEISKPCFHGDVNYSYHTF